MSRNFLSTVLMALSLVFTQVLAQQPTQDALSFLKENMLYVEARPLLLTNGWQPYNFGIQNPQAQLPACIKRVTTLDCSPESTSDICKRRIEICTTFPEYETCGAGPCMMIMEKDGQQLFLSTEGDIGKNNRDEEFVITGWRFDIWKP